MSRLNANYQESYCQMVEYLKQFREVDGLLLGGSRGRQVENDCSDTDLIIIFKNRVRQRRRFRIRNEIYSEYNQLLNLDLGKHSLISLREFKDFGQYGTRTMSSRYSVVNVKLEFDRSGGHLTKYFLAKQSLDDAERDLGMKRFFERYLNKVYRSIHCSKYGDETGAILEAASSIELLLGSMFTLCSRVVPFNKFLNFELAREPLPWIETSELMWHVRQVLASASVDSQSKLLRVIGSAVRESPYSFMMDRWDKLRGIIGDF